MLVNFDININKVSVGAFQWETVRDGKKLKEILDSKGTNVRQIAKATGDTEKFLSMLTEYKNNSKIYSEDTTKYRLLLETMDKILPLVKMYIVDSADGNVDLKLYDSALSGNISVTE